MTSPTPSFDAKVLCKTVLEMAFAGSTVHIGCSFSIIELLAVLYRSHLRYLGNDPLAEIISCSVRNMASWLQYACMHELGWLKDDAFSTNFTDCSDLSKNYGLNNSYVLPAPMREEHGAKVWGSKLGAWVAAS